MNLKYFVYRNGLLYTRTLTNLRAQDIRRELEAKGFKSEVKKEA